MTDLTLTYQTNEPRRSIVTGDVFYGDPVLQRNIVEMSFDEAISSGLYKQAYLIGVLDNHSRISELDLSHKPIIEFIDYISFIDDRDFEEVKQHLEEVKEWLDIKTPGLTIAIKVEKAIEL